MEGIGHVGRLYPAISLYNKDDRVTLKYVSRGRKASSGRKKPVKNEENSETDSNFIDVGETVKNDKTVTTQGSWNAHEKPSSRNYRSSTTAMRGLSATSSHLASQLHRAQQLLAIISKELICQLHLVQQEQSMFLALFELKPYLKLACFVLNKNKLNFLQLK